jgi:hypothetical protein
MKTLSSLFVFCQLLLECGQDYEYVFIVHDLSQDYA